MDHTTGEGFVCSAREPHRNFGEALVGKTWARDLTPE
jgi:hypothetical protein